MITLEQARQHIGDHVIYTTSFDTFDDGTIHSVNDFYVFVNYHGNIKATNPYDLTLKSHNERKPQP